LDQLAEWRRPMTVIASAPGRLPAGTTSVHDPLSASTSTRLPFEYDVK
jgi:hypothetical protein